MSVYTRHILNILNSARFGSTASRVFKSDLFDDAQTVRVVLSSLVARGYAYVDGKMECSECGSRGTCYRISEKGKIHLNGKAA